MTGFFENFIANDEEFGRKLNADESEGMGGFPEANIDGILYLGKGSIRPTNVSCDYYQCMTGGVVHIFNATDNQYQATIAVVDGQIDFMTFIWDKCHSSSYKCSYSSHFGATYNCIGWAMGVTKWLNPEEVTSYINQGMTREQAINKFITDKEAIYKNSKSVVDPILKDLLAKNVTSIPPQNNSVAFYFDEYGNCQHAARYIENFNGRSLNMWTSKLGSSIKIAHSLSDLMGVNSSYGNELHHVSIGGDVSHEEKLDGDL